MVVNHDMGYAPAGAHLTLDQYYRISCVEVFLIMAVRAIFGWNPQRSGQGNATVRNKSPRAIYMYDAPPLFQKSVYYSVELKFVSDAVVPNVLLGTRPSSTRSFWMRILNQSPHGE
jgi:hypothetical protein